MVLDAEGSCAGNTSAGERMEVRALDGTFVVDVQFETGDVGSITLDSGAGVHVWPEDWLREVPMLPRQEGLNMCAANETEIPNLGRKVVRFGGMTFGGRWRPRRDSTGRCEPMGESGRHRMPEGRWCL